MPNSPRQTGFTLVEMVIVAMIVPVLFGAIYMAMANIGHVQDQAGDAITATEKLRTALRRIADELRTSSTVAEDRNENGTLDPTEDLNANGRLDADWSVSISTITFNRMLPDGTYSLPITYRLREGQLEREEMLDTMGRRKTAVITRSVSSFSVLVATNRITIGMVVTTSQRGGKLKTHSSSVTIVQRN